MVLNAIQTVLMVFLILAIGYILCKKGVIVPAQHSPMLSKLIINIATPCLLFHNMMLDFTLDMLRHSFWYFFTALTVQLGTFGLAYALAPVIKLAKNRRGVFAGMCSLSNTIFVGLPVCIGIFGDQSIPYVLFYYAMNTLVFWTIGNYMMNKDAGKTTRFFSVQTLKNVFSPPMLAFLVSLVFIVLRIKLPAIVMDTTKIIGGMTTPLSIIFVGIVLYQAGFNNLKPDKAISVTLLIRMVICPVATFFLARLVGLGSLPAEVFTVQSAMPVMTSYVVVAEMVGADSKFAMRGVVLTTFLSLLLIPVYMLVMPLI